jgi:hypothetical protein
MLGIKAKIKAENSGTRLRAFGAVDNPSFFGL